MFFINIDIKDFQNLTGALREKAIPKIQEAARRLAVATHAHIVEQAKAQLHSTRKMYVKNLRLINVDQNTNIIELDPSVLFLEDGMPAHEMIDDLLKGTEADGVHTARDGSKWRVIPFKQNKAPQDTPESVADLQSTLKAYMKKAKIPYAKIETNSDGAPKLGLLHSFDIMNQPVKTGSGAGQGWGPVGSVKQGPTGIPFLQGVRVYQKMGKDDAGADVAQRDIMTFRIVSSKQKGTGRWMHPGLPARKFLDEGYKWALEQWENTYKDDVLDDILND